ncbi:hypothetical protein KP509_29G064800 [Ceratopteris richardii]|uniref:Uncharacterized protein n=1 Tax=Ceratopteris richardii TaxID=49495 RepID=A0A8T2R7N0_CERRI|nr:hypothetical protein KP509_29G064800 [Ceratopteris richardii]
MADEDSPLSTFVQSIRRDLNCVSDMDRNVRRNSLQRLHKRLTQKQTLPPTPVLQEAWDNDILPILVKSVSDNAESCRELAVQLLVFGIQNSIVVEQTMALCLSPLIERIGNLPMKEDSEEVRLLLIQLVKSLVLSCSLEMLSTNLEPIVQILKSSLADQYHEIKKEACDVIHSVIGRTKNFTQQSLESLLKASIPNLKHPHSKVRLATLQGINMIMKCNVPADTVSALLIPVTEALVFDHSERVRKYFLESVAEWICCGFEESNDNDDHVNLSIFRTKLSHLLPLLICGIFDASKEIGSTALALAENIGHVYTTCATNRRHNSGTADDAADNEMEYHLLLPSPFKERPGRTCCIMVQDFLEELIPHIKNSLQEWAETTKLYGARLLLAVLVFAEQQIAPYLHSIIPTLCSAVGDNNVCIAKLIVASSHILGWQTSPSSWMSQIVGQVSSSNASSVQVANGLVIMSGLLYGTKKHTGNDGLAKEVLKALINLNLQFNSHASVHNQTLAILQNLLKVFGANYSTCSSDILFILVQIQCFGSNLSQKQAVADIEKALADVMGFTSVRSLYESQAELLLGMIIADHETWSTHVHGQALFHAFLQKISNLAGPYLERLLPVLKGCVQPERDPSLRLKLLQILDELFEIEELAVWWYSLASTVLGQIILPCGVWRVGKIGAAIRHAAMVAFGTFLRMNLCSQHDLETHLLSDQVLPVVLSCLEEDYYVDVRIVTCHVLQELLRISGNSLTDKQRGDVQKALQKRLDDSSDGVRLRILPAISLFFRTMPSSYSDASIRSFAANILVHMDDSNVEIRESVFKALQVCTSLRPAILEDLIKSKRDQHEKTEYCDRLLDQAASLQIMEATNA